MKLIIIVMLGLVSTSALAGCVVSFQKPTDTSMTTTFINDLTYKKIISVLTDKGYEVVSPNELHNKIADYHFSVVGNYGYGVGAWGDYLKTPTYYKVSFSQANGTKLYSKSESYLQNSSQGVRVKGREKVLKTLVNIPKCQTI